MPPFFFSRQVFTIPAETVGMRQQRTGSRTRQSAEALQPLPARADRTSASLRRCTNIFSRATHPLPAQMPRRTHRVGGPAQRAQQPAAGAAARLRPASARTWRRWPSANRPLPVIRRTDALLRCGCRQSRRRRCSGAGSQAASLQVRSRRGLCAWRPGERAVVVAWTGGRSRCEHDTEAALSHTGLAR